VIADLPDHESITAVALLAAAGGASEIRTTVLITPEGVDEAVKKPPHYRPAGE
jgi:hypothetical protein